MPPIKVLIVDDEANLRSLVRCCLEDVEEGYAQTLLAVRGALQARRFAEAERKLIKAGTITSEEPAFLNLAGILHEFLGRHESARKFYSRAVAKDRSYRPAQANLERLGEIRRNGRSKIHVDFGGDDPDAGLEGLSCAATGSCESRVIASPFKRHLAADKRILLPARAEADDESIRGHQPRGARIKGAIRRLSKWRPQRQVRVH